MRWPPLKSLPFSLAPFLMLALLMPCPRARATSAEPAPPPGFSRQTVRTERGPVTVILPRRELRFTPAGRTFYLAHGGSDAGDGSRARPWATFAHAIAQLQPGDLLYACGGEYAEPFEVNKIAGTAQRPIVISAAPGEAVRIVQPPGWQAANVHKATVMLKDTAHVWLHGFTIEGCRGQAGAPPGDTYGQNGISIQARPGQGRGIRILNNTVSRAQHCGIKDINKAAGLLIEGNVVYDCGLGSLDHGMYITGSDTVIRGNAVFQCSGYGLHLYVAPARLRVYNNICFRNGQFGIIVGGPDNIVAHNVLAYNKRAGLFLYRGGCTGNVFVNNICLGNGGGQIAMDNGGGKLGPPGGNTIDFSAAWPAKGWAGSTVSGWAGGQMLLQDPLLAAPERGDWRLGAASPCRGKAGKVDLGLPGSWPDLGLFPATQYAAGGDGASKD